MKLSNIVYRRLAMSIALLGVSRKDVSDRLGITYGTLHNKLCGNTPFTLDEAIQIKALLGSHAPLEELFAREERSV